MMLCRHITTTSPLCAHVCARARARPLWVMPSRCSVPWETLQEMVCEQIWHLLQVFAPLFQCPASGRARFGELHMFWFGFWHRISRKIRSNWKQSRGQQW